MKKILVIIALLVMSMSITSCETVGEGPCIDTEVSDLG